MNKCILVGNLTRDPELTTTPNGTNVCKFSIAVNRTFANADGEREADFLNIVTWRILADNCAKFLSKGKKVAICGRLQTRSYDDKDGNKRYVTEIMTDEVEFLTPISEGQPSENFSPVKKTASELKPVEDDGLPF